MTEELRLAELVGALSLANGRGDGRAARARTRAVRRRRAARRRARLRRSHDAARLLPRAPPPCQLHAGSHPAVSGCPVERAELAAAGQLLEGAPLDLADALARDAEAPADLLEGERLRLHTQAEAVGEDLLLPLGQLVERSMERFEAQADLELLLRRLLGARQQLA